MRTITAVEGQTVFDIALQEMGSVEGIWDILESNAFLRIDQQIPAGQVVFIPDKIINASVVDYYTRNNIKPASGLGEVITLNEIDMINIPQVVNYALTDGNEHFDGVRLANMGDELTIQVNYEEVNDTVDVFPEQSLDGINFSPIMDNDLPMKQTIVSGTGSLTFNINNLVTNFGRIKIECTVGTEGHLTNIIWRQ